MAGDLKKGRKSFILGRVEEVAHFIKDNPKKKTREVAKELGTSKSTIARARKLLRGEKVTSFYRVLDMHKKAEYSNPIGGTRPVGREKKKPGPEKGAKYKPRRRFS